MEQPTLLTRIEALLDGPEHAPWEAVLDELLHHFGCAVATVHLLDGAGLLQLVAQRGLPPVVLDRVRTVPVGKGMAGIAAERRAPVQVCNLQTDASGVVRPGAKDTRMEGSIACPMFDGAELRGVLGVAKPVPHEFTSEQQALLLAVGSKLARLRA